MKTSLQNLGLVLTLGAVISGPVQLLAKPVTAEILTDESSVKFQGKALANILEFDGSGKGIVGKISITDQKTMQGSATFPMLNLDADVRTKHMREYLDVGKFPEAVFSPTQLPWQDPSLALTQETKDGAFEGKMTIRGVEKPVKGTVSSKPQKDGKVLYTFAFNVLLSDFSIPAPVYKGVGVKDEINVTVNALAKVDAK